MRVSINFHSVVLLRYSKWLVFYNITTRTPAKINRGGMAPPPSPCGRSCITHIAFFRCFIQTIFKKILKIYDHVIYHVFFSNCYLMFIFFIGFKLNISTTCILHNERNASTPINWFFHYYYYYL